MFPGSVDFVLENQGTLGRTRAVVRAARRFLPRQASSRPRQRRRITSPRVSPRRTSPRARPRVMARTRRRRTRRRRTFRRKRTFNRRRRRRTFRRSRRPKQMMSTIMPPVGRATFTSCHSWTVTTRLDDKQQRLMGLQCFPVNPWAATPHADTKEPEFFTEWDNFYSELRCVRTDVEVMIINKIFPSPITLLVQGDKSVGTLQGTTPTADETCHEKNSYQAHLGGVLVAANGFATKTVRFSISDTKLHTTINKNDFWGTFGAIPTETTFINIFAMPMVASIVFTATANVFEVRARARFHCLMRNRSDPDAV